VGWTINTKTDVGDRHVGFTCGFFDFAFLSLVSSPRQPFNPPLAARSTLNSFRSLQSA
jgi:hypothetical protein